MPNILHESIAMPFEERVDFYEEFYRVAYKGWSPNGNGYNESRALVVKAIHTQQVERYLAEGEQ